MEPNVTTTLDAGIDLRDLDYDNRLLITRNLSADADAAEDPWDDLADERFYLRQEAAEDAWLAHQDQHRPAPDPWRTNPPENP